MRIPSGDLAPARRGSRGYGRRRRVWPALLSVVAVAVVSGGAYLLARDDNGAPQRVAGPGASPCASGSPTPRAASAPPVTAPKVVLPAPGKVAFRLLNGSPRDGLGRSVGEALAKRGFVVKSTGNAPKALTGTSRVYYGPGAQPAAQLVAIHVIGAELSPVPSAARGAVDLVLGTTFARLRTPAEVASFTQRVLAGTAPTKASAAAVPSPRGCT